MFPVAYPDQNGSVELLRRAAVQMSDPPDDVRMSPDVVVLQFGSVGFPVIDTHCDTQPTIAVNAFPALQMLDVVR